MAEHEELVAEMETVTKLSIQERLQLAKSRRMEQLKSYERCWKVTAHAPSIKQNGGSKSCTKNVRFDSKTRLFEAASRGDAEEVRSLLKSGECQPNSTNSDGFTVLHICCIDGHLELIRNLIQDFGASVNEPDHELWTPLHTVALCGRAQVSQLLIENGADLLALNIDANMPYDICEDEQTLDIIELEMSKQDVTQDQIEDLRMAREKQMLEDLQRLSKQSGELEKRGIHCETPLHVAAANGYTTVAKLLLDSNVAVDPEDDDLWQPIHCAAKWRQLPVLELLIINGAKLTPTTNDGRTPLELCDDSDIQTWMKELKQEVDSKNTSLANSRQRLMDIIASRSSVQMQLLGSNGGSSSQIYSSNVSLADGSKISSSNRHLPTSEKESLSKKTAQEEARTRLSLQSLNENSDASVGVQPLVKDSGELKQPERPSPNGHSTSSHEDGNNRVTKVDCIDSRTPSPTREANGHLVAGNGNSLPKSCLKKTNSENHTETSDPLNTTNRSRRKHWFKAECCLIS